MNYNASLQEKIDNMNMSQGAATFLLKTLSGNTFEIVDYNGTQCIVWNDGVRMAGMQPLNIFMKSLEMTGNENTPEAYIALMKTDMAAFGNKNAEALQKQNKTAQAVFETFENADPSQVNNCVDQTSKFTMQTNNNIVENSLREIIQASMLDKTRATEAIARDVRDNWNAIVR